jgi:hypothetical protein
VIEKMEAEIKRPELKTTMVGNDSLQMTSNRYRNMMVRITRGRGVGQERAISAITDKALTVAPGMGCGSGCEQLLGGDGLAIRRAEPNVAGTVRNSEPIGETVEIFGRAANVNHMEFAAELSTITRGQIGRSGTGDADVPPMPFFGLNKSAEARWS